MKGFDELSFDTNKQEMSTEISTAKNKSIENKIDKPFPHVEHVTSPLPPHRLHFFRWLPLQVGHGRPSGCLPLKKYYYFLLVMRLTQHSHSSHDLDLHMSYILQLCYRYNSCISVSKVSLNKNSSKDDHTTSVWGTVFLMVFSSKGAGRLHFMSQGAGGGPLEGPSTFPLLYGRLVRSTRRLSVHLYISNKVNEL